MEKQYFTIEGRALRNALKPHAAVVERRNSYPILGTVRLALGAHGLTITSTDLDMELETSVDVIDGEGEWPIQIDAQSIASIARLAGPMTVKIERTVTTPAKAKDAKHEPTPRFAATITVGEGEVVYELGDTMDPDGWARIYDRGRPDNVIERFTNGQLAANMKKVAYCISREETRYYVNGINWERSGNGCRFVATDGHRLAACTYQNAFDEDATQFIIPRKVCEFIINHMAGRDIAIHATDKPTILHIESGDMTLFFKTIEGTYPDTDRVTPKGTDANHEFELKSSEAIASIDRAMALNHSKNRYSGRALKFMEQGGVMALQSVNPDVGSATVKTQAAWPKGAGEFGFNAIYMREMLIQCEGDARLLMRDRSSPYLVLDADPTMKRVIMPMRV